MSCEVENDIQKYHDGELSPARQLEVEDHLQTCGICQTLLTQLRRVSLAVRSAAMPVMTSQTLRRVADAWRQARDRMVARTAGWLTAAASILLAVGLALLSQERATGRNQAKGPTTNDSVAIVTGSEAIRSWDTLAQAPSTEAPGSEFVQVAQWMADDLSAGSKR